MLDPEDELPGSGSSVSCCCTIAVKMSRTLCRVPRSHGHFRVGATDSLGGPRSSVLRARETST